MPDLDWFKREELRMEAEERDDLTREEINRLADAEGWPAFKRAAFHGRRVLHEALAMPVEEVGAGSILLGGGGPILVGRGFDLPSFLELPRPWWCPREGRGPGEGDPG